MDLKRIFIILVDISGYTRFIKFHKVALLHAEKIVAELMEAVLERVEVPVVAHEILGDAISMYAIDDGVPGTADHIYQQLEGYFKAFWHREASLISACKLCECDACHQVGQLKLKAILHVGEAAFTTVFNKPKISGEDVIVSHRLLKNSIPSNEYILMTRAFADRCHGLEVSRMQEVSEICDGIGEVQCLVRNFEASEVPEAHVSFVSKIMDFLRVEGYMIARLFRPVAYRFRNIPEHPNPGQ